MNGEGMEKMHLDHAQMLARHESRLEQHQQTIERLEKKQDAIQKLVTSVSLIAKEQTNMKQGFVELKEDLGNKMSSIETKISEQQKDRKKWWEKAWDYMLRAAITAIVGYVLIRLGIG